MRRTRYDLDNPLSRGALAAMLAGGAPAGGGAVNTISLAHFNEGSGTSTSDAVAGVTWALSGSSAIDSANKQFGASSLLTTDTLASGFGAQASGLAAGTNAGVWTWEGFYYGDDVIGFSFGRNRLARSAGPSANPAVEVYLSSDSFSITVTLWNQAGSSIGTSGNVGITIDPQTWYHWAVVRTAGTYYVYFNGSRVYSSFGALGDVGDFTYQWLGGDSVNDVHHDEVRVSKVDRYTGATYTVPTGEFTLD